MAPAPREGRQASRRPGAPSGGRGARGLPRDCGPGNAKAPLFQSIDPAGRRLTDGPGAVAPARPGDDQAAGGRGRRRGCWPRPAATRSGRPGLRHICRMGGRLSTRSGSPGTRRRRRRSSTTGRRTRSASTRSSASCSESSPRRLAHQGPNILAPTRCHRVELNSRLGTPEWAGFD